MGFETHGNHAKSNPVVSFVGFTFVLVIALFILPPVNLIYFVFSYLQ
jgi:hypothetical protein